MRFVDLKSTMEFLEGVLQDGEFNLHAGRLSRHKLHNTRVSIKFREFYQVITEVIPTPGVQGFNKFNFNKGNLIKFISADRVIFASGNHLNIRSLSPTISIPVKFLLTGDLRSFSTAPPKYYTRQHYFRAYLPQAKIFSHLDEFENSPFQSGRFLHRNIIINFHDTEIRFFQHKQGVVIDALDKITIERFERIIQIIELVSGLLKGRRTSSPAYIFSYSSSKMISPKNVRIHNQTGDTANGFQLFTSRPQDLTYLESKLTVKRDESGKVTSINRSSISKYQRPFCNLALNSICKKIDSSPQMLQAIWIYNSVLAAPLEVQLPSFFVSLEYLAIALGGKNKVAKVLTGTLLGEVENELSQIKKNIKSHFRNEISAAAEDERTALKRLQERVMNKLGSVLSESNNQALIEPFNSNGYILSEDEKKFILSNRNIYIHGNRSLQIIDDRTRLKYTKDCFIIQKLVGILFLKSAGFCGYILNNLKMYDYMFESKVKEKLFEKI